MRLYEDKLNLKYIAGVDEAGRGPVAGPVVSAAVILRSDYNNPLINDSKKLTKKQRELCFEDIQKNAISIGVSIISHEIIDEINILEATKLSMTNAINDLDIKTEHVLIDAVRLDLDYNSTSIIKGDSLSISIAAASIIAKVTRDRLMIEFDLKYPMYGFINHQGYLTKKHREAIELHGPCEIHRKTFAPIKNMLNNN